LKDARDVVDCTQNAGIARIERELVGTALVYPDMAGQLLDAIKPEHFFSNPNSLIWKSITSVFADSGVVTASLIINDLECRNDIAAVGGPSYIAALLEHSIPVDAVMAANVRSLKQDYQRRRFQVGAWEMAKVASQDLPRNLTDTVQDLRDTTAALIAQEPETSGKPSGYDREEAMKYVLDKLVEAVESDSSENAVSGIQELDKMTTGFHSGEMIVVAARPGAGKTAAALSFALSSARQLKKHDKSVLFFSLEMPLEQLWYRAIAQSTDVPLGLFRDPKELKSEHWEKIHLGIADLQEQPIVFDCSAVMTPEEICIRARTQKERCGLGLVVVDYLQLVHVPDEQFREQAVAHISRTMKRMALDLEVPVIALSQLNRAIEHRTTRAPILSDLRESGSIEQDADAVIFVHRPALWDKEAEPSDAEFIVAKQRNGPLGRVDAYFDCTTTKFKSPPASFDEYEFRRDRGRQGDTDYEVF